MLKHIEHIGIAVDSLEEASKIFDVLFEKKAYKDEVVASEGVTTRFYKIGNTKIELLQANNSTSPIAKFLEKKGKGVHHLAFETDDIESEISRLTSAGFNLIHSTPKKGADNKRIAFLHPKSTEKVLIELCQENNT